jgi:hypothetical protein
LGIVTINWGVKLLRFEINEVEFLNKYNFNFIIKPSNLEKMVSKKLHEKIEEKLNEKTKTPIITEVE